MAKDSPAAEVLADVDQLLATASGLETWVSSTADAIRSRAHRMRADIAMRQLAQVPVARLRETAKGLRIEPLERAGYRTLDQILAARANRLARVEGVGPATVNQVVAAARQVLAASESAVRLHFDVVARPQDQTELLGLLRAYDTGDRAVTDLSDAAGRFRQRAQPLRDRAALTKQSWFKRVSAGGAARAASRQAVVDLQQLMATEGAALRRALAGPLVQLNKPRSPAAIWSDYENNAAGLLGVLAEVEGTAEAANEGHLPAEIVERVRAQSLDRSLLKAGLRGYQAFGAKYALVQRRTILGDEMGLGKTVEALAVMCHLRAGGQDRALVVCPASVVANWRSELHRHTKLAGRVLHGVDRDYAYAAWLRQSGVAITTFDSLRRLELAPGTRPALLVVDEAHYVKNPRTLRAQSVAAWAGQSERVLYLTGTPMENRVEEFRSLLDQLQPAVARRVNATTALAGVAAFQTAVAPAYLRRNQLDVLNELPELIPSLDWIDPTARDLVVYRRAVSDKAFQTMRRAAYLSIADGGPGNASDIEHSAKTDRLIDIVREATDEQLKIVVFSYFRDVLDRVTRAAQIAVPGGVFGPLTGSTAPAERQRMIDSLTSRQGGAVLTSQIEAGGVGLNMQAASVVVLCEPQWKPTIEAQAIARCHRMGQVRRVQVHRLLLEDTVDQRMLAILANKQHLIEQYVSGSAIKDATPESVDVSDLENVDRVVNEVQAEALIIASERRRLGLDLPRPA